MGLNNFQKTSYLFIYNISISVWDLNMAISQNKKKLAVRPHYTLHIKEKKKGPDSFYTRTSSDLFLLNFDWEFKCASRVPLSTLQFFLKKKSSYHHSPKFICARAIVEHIFNILLCRNIHDNLLLIDKTKNTKQKR